MKDFRAKFGESVHPFTGVDYIEFYSDLIRKAGAEVEVIFANRVQAILSYADTVIPWRRWYMSADTSRAAATISG